jgi:phospholipid/cholesterol/gamma-HCH transport system substrate-binding protein
VRYGLAALRADTDGKDRRRYGAVEFGGMPSQNRVRWAKIRSFVSAVAALAILGTLVYLLSGGTLFEQKAILYAYIPDATGLAAGSPVRVDGIDVGKVVEVSLSGSTDPKRVVRVVTHVERASLPQMPADSWVQISSDTLIGDKFVDISSGRSPDHIQPNSELTYREQTDLMRGLDLEQFAKKLREMDAIISDIEQGKSLVGQFVVGTDVYNELRKSIRLFDDSLRAAVSTTTAVGRELYGTATYDKIRAPIVELDRTLARVQSGQGTAGQLLRDNGGYEQARSLVQELDRAVRDIHASEFVQSDAAYQAWNGLAVSLIQRVDEFNAGTWFANSATYDNLTMGIGELGKTVKEFREDPAKFLRLKVF